MVSFSPLLRRNRRLVFIFFVIVISMLYYHPVYSYLRARGRGLPVMDDNAGLMASSDASGRNHFYSRDANGYMIYNGYQDVVVDGKLRHIPSGKIQRIDTDGTIFTVGLEPEDGQNGATMSGVFRYNPRTDARSGLANRNDGLRMFNNQNRIYMSDSNVAFELFPSTRNDAVVHQPTAFFYPDSNGELRVAPISKMKGVSGTAKFICPAKNQGGKNTYTVTHKAGFASYKVWITPGNESAAVPYYINNKTDTTFDITFMSRPTASSYNIVFDWMIN